MVKRVPIKLDNLTKLVEDEVIKKFENLVKYAAKRVSESSTLEVSMDVQDLYQEGMLLLFKHYLKYSNKSIDEFRVIFTSSLFRHLHHVARKKGVVKINLESAYDLGYEENIVDQIYFEHCVSHMKELLRDDVVCTAILQELTEPSERTIWEMIMDGKRKEHLKSQGKRVNITQNTKIKMIHICRSLGISSKALDEGLVRIRNLAKSGVFADIAY